jgi:hypothetical protein
MGLAQITPHSGGLTMVKKMMLLATMAVAVVAFVAPAAASANWTHNGSPLTENVHLQFHGTWKFEGALGRVHCEDTTMTVELTSVPGNIAHVIEFTVDNPTVDCRVSGVLAAICGERSLHETYLTHNGLATINGGAIELSEIELVTVFGETPKPCAEVILTDNSENITTATPDNPEEIHSVSLGGSLEDNFGGKEQFSGVLNATPSGTYGIE